MIFQNFSKNNKTHSAPPAQNKLPSKKQTAQSGSILKTWELLLENPE